MTRRRRVAIGPALSLWLGRAAAAAGVVPIVWGFESDAHGWQPRAAGVRVSRMPGERPDSRGTLRVQGEIADGWNYAWSEPRPGGVPWP